MFIYIIIINDSKTVNFSLKSLLLQTIDHARTQERTRKIVFSIFLLSIFLQIATAVRFLENSKIRSTSVELKTSFLKKKGLTDEVRTMLFKNKQKSGFFPFSALFITFCQVWLGYILFSTK